VCLERGEFLKKCGNFAGKFGKGKVRSTTYADVTNVESIKKMIPYK